MKYTIGLGLCACTQIWRLLRVDTIGYIGTHLYTEAAVHIFIISMWSL